MLALAVLLATAPVLQMSEQQLDRAIADAHLVPAIGERVERLSKLFLGVPYGDFPLGEGSGVEPQPRWRVDKVDCQTFVETVLAMANAKSLDRARAVLDDIRYAGDPRAASTTLTLRRVQWEKVPGLRRLSPAKIPKGEFPIQYLSLDQAKKRAGSIEPGSVLLVVRQHDPKRVVRVSHMGFVVRKDGRLYVRHASFGDEHRVIDLELSQFLDKQREYKKWPVQGIALALPLDAQARVKQLTASR